MRIQYNTITTDCIVPVLSWKNPALPCVDTAHCLPYVHGRGNDASTCANDDANACAPDGGDPNPGAPLLALALGSDPCSPAA